MIFILTNTAAPRARSLAAERAAYQAAGIGKYVEAAPGRRFVQSADRTDLHCQDFIQCVRERRQPNADVDTGHRSTIVAHLINIAFRTDRKLAWDSATETIKNSTEAQALVTRQARQPWKIVPGT